MIELLVIALRQAWLKEIGDNPPDEDTLARVANAMVAALTDDEILELVDNLEASIYE